MNLRPITPEELERWTREAREQAVQRAIAYQIREMRGDGYACQDQGI